MATIAAKLFGATLFLVFAALLFGALERLFGSGPRRRRWGLDVAWFYAGLLVDPLVKLGTAVSLAGLVLALQRPLDDSLKDGYGPLALLPQPVQLVLVLFVADGIGYLMHRLHHHPALWRLHAVHHSSEHLDWLASVRVHPLNELVQRTPAAVILVLMGFQLHLVAAAAPLLALYGVGLHADLPWRFGPLRYLVATPAFHRWHHARVSEGGPEGGCNFSGLFPIWDLLFGTFYLPQREPRLFGIDGEAPPERLLGQLLWPVRWSSVSLRVSAHRSR